MLATIEQVIRQVLPPRDTLGAIGVACAGQIDPRTGTVVYAPNLDWREVPLGGRLSGTFGVPVTVENDVRSAAWGEYRFGAGSAAESLIAVFVGTGIGSGAVLGRALWRGSGNVAGEIGHTQVVPGGLPCPCGARGCLERYAAGRGLQDRLAEALARGVATALAEATGGDAERLTASMVAVAAAGGDALAREIWGDAERYLTMAVANYVTLLNPEVLVLGGGVIDATPALADTVADGVRRLTTVLARRTLRVERARLGGWSGVVGAAALAAGL